LMMQDMQNF